MEIIFICTRSITFNTFLESQAKFLSKKGYKIKVACADIENLNFKNSYNYKINFPTEYIHLINIIRFLRASFYKLIEKILSFKTNVFITINNEDYNYAKSCLFNKPPTYKINGVGLDLKKKNFKILQ